MEEIHLSADQPLLDALRTPVASRRRWDTETTLRLAQTVALLCAGCWAYFIYATYTKESNALALDAARVHKQQSALTLHQTELDLKKGSIEVDRLEQTPLTTTEEVRIEPVVNATGWYLVSYTYTLTNSGSKMITIDPLMAEAFVARTPTAQVKAPIVINDVGERGTLTWECISRRGFTVASNWQPNQQVTNDPDIAPAERGGGGTGSISAGEHLDGIITILVPGKPTDFVGFRVRFTINSSSDQPNRRRLREFAALGVTTSEHRR